LQLKVVGREKKENKEGEGLGGGRNRKKI